jgi:peptide/nickel transport system substrate-binding protein
MDRLAANPDLRMSSTAGPFMYLNFNGTTGPFKDVRVRQAMALAVNRDDVAQAAFYGHARSLYGLPLSSDTPFYDENLANFWRYDPRRAQELLAAAGLGGGFSCTLLANGSSSMTQSTAVVVQQNLAEIGIQVQLALMEYSTYLKMSTEGKYDLAVCGNTLDSNDPDGLTPIIDGSLPSASARSWGMHIPELTRLLAAGRSEFDQARRKVIYDQLQRVALDQVPSAFLVLREQAYAMRKNVHGFDCLPGQLTFYSGYTLEEAYLA